MDVGKTVKVVFKNTIVFVSKDKRRRKAISPGQHILRLERIQNGQFSAERQNYFVIDGNDSYALPAEYMRELEQRGEVSFPHKK